MNNRRAMRRFVNGLAVAFLLCTVNSVTADPLPVGTPFPGQNFLSGQSFGLDENYVAATSSGWYTMPSGSNATPDGTPGMTESIFTGSRVGAPNGGLNLPQPSFVPPSDSRHAISSPLSAPGTVGQWPARAGAVVRWDMLSDIGGNLIPLLPPAGSVTGIVLGLTPKQFTSTTPSITLLNDGLSPGSAVEPGPLGVPGVFPDTMAFATDFSGRRALSFELSFFGNDADSAALFAATGVPAVPSQVIPVVEWWDGGANLTLNNNLLESDIDHNGGIFGATASPARDGDPLLIGQLGDAFVQQTILETARDSGEFVLDIQFQGNVEYIGGDLVSSGVVAAGSTGTLSANWEDVPFPVSGAGGIFPNGSYDRNGIDSYDFRPGGSFSADQSFTTDAAIPEPVTATLVVLAISALGNYGLGRSRWRRA